MPELREILTPALAARQADFASALFEGDCVPQGLRGAARGIPRRFGVYRNNVHASLIGCLRSTYPAVRRLVGDDFFNAAARLFVERTPPTSPVLLAYGGGFDSFLQSFGPARAVPYLADVARLEWHVACASHAEDASPIDGAVLGRMTTEEAADARLLLHPSLRLMRSPFPVVSIWQTNIHDADVCNIGAHGGEAAFIVRPQFAVRVVRIERTTFEFLAALSAGYALAAAAAIAGRCSPDFDLTASLMQIFGCGAIVDVAGQAHPSFHTAQ